MKQAREYAKEWSLNNNNDQIDKQDFIAAVKQVQKETIDEMFKNCNDEASIHLMVSDTPVVAIRSVLYVAEQLKQKL